ncbi:hypothetical protein QTP70_019698, partial [Hemibagrus guttatus]
PECALSFYTTTDAQIGEALLISMIKYQINAYSRGADVSLPQLPVVQPFTNEKDEKLYSELAQMIKVIAEVLEKDHAIKNQIDDVARLGDKKSFSKLMQSVFDDGQISWARIIVLFYVVGKLCVKMLLANLPNVFSEILKSCLDYFREKLLAWIRSVGGWIGSISALTQFSIERTSASSLSTIPLPAALFTTFFLGILLGGVIVWKVKTSS